MGNCSPVADAFTRLKAWLRARFYIRTNKPLTGNELLQNDRVPSR